MIMNILMIEDDPNKAREIKSFISESFPNINLYQKNSFISGLKFLLSPSVNINLVILDMSLPTYDIKPGEDGARFRYTAGKDILKELKRKNQKTKVVIVTQFERFGEGLSQLKLTDLIMELVREYKDNYIETIYYNASQSNWKLSISEIIKKIQQNDQSTSN